MATNESITLDFKAHTQEVTTALNGISKRLDGIGSGFSSKFSAVGRGLAGLFAGGAIVGGIKSAISGASDLAETVSKVNTIFGASAGKITAFADQMASAFGLPKQEMLDAASNLGTIAKSAGYTQDQAAVLGTQFGKLGADLSSFFNVSSDQALNALSAGLRGESEPLRQFGVTMDENSVKLEAFKLGLYNGSGELSNYAKTQARASIILRQTKDAQGDLERTSGGFANQLRKLSGRVTNFTAEVGTKLLPVGSILIDLFQNIATDIEESFKTGALKTFFDYFQSAVEAIQIAYRNWGSVVEYTQILIQEKITNAVETFQWLGSVVGAFLDWFGTNWRTIFADAFNAVITALQNLGQNFLDFGKSAYDWIASGFQKPFQFKMTPVLQGFSATTPALQVPELKLTNLQAEKDAVFGKMLEKETKRIEAIDEASKKTDKKADEKIADTTLPDVPPEEQKKQDQKSETIGIREMLDRVQGGVGGKNDEQKQIAKDQKKSREALEKMLQMAKTQEAVLA
jgi:hypothetical protein